MTRGADFAPLDTLGVFMVLDKTKQIGNQQTTINIILLGQASASVKTFEIFELNIKISSSEGINQNRSNIQILNQSRKIIKRKTIKNNPRIFS